MNEIHTIALDEQQCPLNFAWGTPELVAAADLIEDYWHDSICAGPTSTLYTDKTFGTGRCKLLFQNWLVKNPYYITSYAASGAKSNWGAAATNATAYIADYVWDRPDVRLVHRHPPEMNEGKDKVFTAAEAYVYANQLALERMNGYGVEYLSSSSCDFLDGKQQSNDWPVVKSQITESGMIPEDARREEFCNIPEYNGKYQNYPQIHLNNNIQQCELMLRRGNRACYDNIDMSEIPDFKFAGPDGELKTIHLYPGRGSIERAIDAIIVDSNTEWRHDSALEVAYHYYFLYHRFEGIERWFEQLNRPSACSQGICFGMLTHGFAPGETPQLPPTVPPPGAN
jgi:hypothetical protein